MKPNRIANFGTRVVSTLLLAACSFSVLSAGVNVSPLRLDFKPGVRTESLVLTNLLDAKLPVQIKAYLWEQNEDGRTVLSPTRDLLFSPPITNLKPAEKQTIRFRLRKGADAEEERAYRVIVEQLVPKNAAGTVFKVRMSLPIFVEPIRKQLMPQPVMKVEDMGNGQLSVEVTNNGNAHIRIRGVALVPSNIRKHDLGSDDALAKTSVSSIGTDYLLQGTTAKWVLDAGRAIPSGNYNVVFVTDYRDRLDFSEQIDEDGHLWFPIKLM